VYTPPNRHSTLRVKATLKSVQDDLTSGGDDEGDTLENVLGEDSTFPFTFDGSTITNTGTPTRADYHVSNFDTQSTVAADVTILGYQMTGGKPGYSFAMQGLYHLGRPTGDTPATPKKRKGDCLLSPRRQKGAPFVADPSTFPTSCDIDSNLSR
jgi:hypothetical protein